MKVQINENRKALKGRNMLASGEAQREMRDKIIVACSSIKIKR